MFVQTMLTSSNPHEITYLSTIITNEITIVRFNVLMFFFVVLVLS